MLNLDTHVLVFALAGRLHAREKELLRSHEWSVSAIVHWELAKLVQLRRLSLDLEDREVAITICGLRTWPLDLQTAIQSTRLDFNGDPADELIAATSIVHDVPLLTRDQAIRRSEIVPLAIR